MTGQLSSHSAGQGVKPTAYNSCSRHSFYPICTDSQQAPKQVTKTDSRAHLCEKSVLQSKYFFCDFPMSSSSFFDTILSLLLDTREKRSASQLLCLNGMELDDHMTSREKEPAPPVPGFSLLYGTALSMLTARRHTTFGEGVLLSTSLPPLLSFSLLSLALFCCHYHEHEGSTQWSLLSLPAPHTLTYAKAKNPSSK